MASYDHFFEEYQDFVEKKLRTSKADIPYCVMGLSEEIIEFELAKNDQKEMLLEAGDVIYYIMLMSILEPCIELNYENVDRSLPVENLYTILQKRNKIDSNYSYRNLLRERFINQMERLLQDLIDHITIVTGCSIRQLAHLNMAKLTHPTEVDTHLQVHLTLNSRKGTHLSVRETICHPRYQGRDRDSALSTGISGARDSATRH
jgi:phosphoribosyl-ATP pyrophosphohydrolase